MSGENILRQGGVLTRLALQVRQKHGSGLGDVIVANIYSTAEEIAQKVVVNQKVRRIDWDHKLDDYLTSKVFGFPIMLMLLSAVFWLTIEGANVPSNLLADMFLWGQLQLTAFFQSLGAPDWLHGILVLGMYQTAGWVISVMLPPMAIFFPLFTLLEDLGYLPRVAFNLDKFFKNAGAHGKQSLTMSMGFGCNAAGVISCRIIDSPRERLIAILTNNFVPCNGRFPTLIMLAALLMGGLSASFSGTGFAAAIVVVMVLIGITVTLFTSWALSKSVLKGTPSTFTLELPPYRKPQIIQILIRSIFDRTLFVLRRAVVVALPAGVVIWLLANVPYEGQTLLNAFAAFLDPFAYWLGLDGYILLAFILGLPANEIVVPILIMSYMAAGNMVELEEFEALRALFLEHGWTWLTALNMMLFSLLHWPCATSILTIKKETGSAWWTLAAFWIPTAIAIGVTFLIAFSARSFGMV